jgi:photosystem II stability/assembly factor-like uncharacterized protein
MVIPIREYPVRAADNSWSLEDIPGVSGKFLAPGTDISDIAVASDNNTIYITDRESDSIFKSTDAGSTWFDLSNPAGISEPQLIAVAPDDAGIVALIADNNGVYISQDGGMNWTDLLTIQAAGGAAASILYDITVSPEDSSIHYVAVAGVEEGSAANIWYYALNVVSPEWKEANNLPGFSGVNTDRTVALAFSANFAIDGVLLSLTEEGRR